jgi:cytochrome c
MSQLDSFLGPHAVTIISIPLAFRCAATGARQRCPLRFDLAAQRGALWASSVPVGTKWTPYEISFKKCLICHSVGPGAQNKIGPAQNGLDGRKAGSVANYQYSDANKNSGIVWNEATFKEYIKDPKAKIPGTKMAFAGIKNDQEINDLWAYLKQFDANGNIKK